MRYNLAQKKWENVPSSELKVGDIVKIEEETIFPCDICYLVSSSPEGDAFIKTSSLDGEKNLKKRIQPKDWNKKVPPGDNIDQAVSKIAALNG